ncbi:Cytoplasmic axial filament protein CafA and Ribonuclease G [invertebrate metagenome]|uniref:Cytoplasmic axial filament protein CafA and Ribonuclease G n=1 Tax=invertebrate metagenome TaxID=1711999 RepID=A0A484H8X6_9ZZZZ
MAKRMLIEATHPEETRVVVVNGTRLEELDVETSTKKKFKGNVYLAKVARIEPALQAAFMDYGSSRHGFLALGEMHPDYYHISPSERQRLLAEQSRAELTAHEEDMVLPSPDDASPDRDSDDAHTAPFDRPLREYKIQDVIKRRQVMLVQVVKEERGNKGAALTTYLSLAGRYCVLMPNTTKHCGISRKITSLADRRRLKALLTEFNIPNSMAVILRTAGAERGKSEIRRDYDYLVRTWNQIREVTLQSQSPALVYEEANLIKRAIRDLYTRDIDEIIVAGEEGYRLAKDFMKMLTPSHAKKVHRYKEEEIPLFHRHKVASQLDAMHSAAVQLRSGGYVVFSQTEALVAIDVNSGKATRERHIEETALNTNIEAAEEIARQLRLRDLAGLIVIDFIDMEESKNNLTVEKCFKEALKSDRARIQVGRISPFGLMELSRQRLRPSLMETSFQSCPYCNGTGLLRSVESAAMHVLRAIEEEGLRHRSLELSVTCPNAVALYLLNHKRLALARIENRYGFHVFVCSDGNLVPPAYHMERIKVIGNEEADIAPESLLEMLQDGTQQNIEGIYGGKDHREHALVTAADRIETIETNEELFLGDMKQRWQQYTPYNCNRWLNSTALISPNREWSRNYAEDEDAIEGRHAAEDVYAEEEDTIAYTEEEDAIEDDAYAEDEDAIEDDAYTEEEDAIEDDAYTEEEDAIEDDAYTEEEDAIEDDAYTEEEDAIEERNVQFLPTTGGLTEWTTVDCREENTASSRRRRRGRRGGRRRRRGDEVQTVGAKTKTAQSIPMTSGVPIVLTEETATVSTPEPSRTVPDILANHGNGQIDEVGPGLISLPMRYPLLRSSVVPLLQSDLSVIESVEQDNNLDHVTTDIAACEHEKLADINNQSEVLLQPSHRRTGWWTR